MNTLRAVLYNRVSSDDQADYGTGLETQEIECRRLAERLGFAIVAVESDPGISGTEYPRPGIERALRMLETGQADVLIAYNPSRLGRKVMVGAMIWERIQQAGARLFLTDMGEVTTKNEAMFFMGCTFAQHQWRDLIENMRNGKRRRAEHGSMPCRNLAPFGYQIIKNNEVGPNGEEPGQYVVIEEIAVIVREIFLRYSAGESLSSLCRWLQQAGILPPQAGRCRSKSAAPYWHSSVISRMLRNTAYIGTAVYGKTESRKVNGRRVDHKTAPEKQIRIPVPPIIEK